uniref:Uncharacterized protein n=1 Tax=Megaselia scalaris TaxID=36166 RepID=T1GRZ8_MEGSC
MNGTNLEKGKHSFLFLFHPASQPGKTIKTHLGPTDKIDTLVLVVAFSSQMGVRFLGIWEVRVHQQSCYFFNDCFPSMIHQIF